jgi:rare lipoprotein A (peptidoglycan hydrolase)
VLSLYGCRVLCKLMLLKTILKTALFSSMITTALAPVKAVEVQQTLPNYGNILDYDGVEKFMPKEFNHGFMMASNASWYGPGFYGNTTACGEVYRPGTLTAAHKSLPCGTRVKVTDTYNGRSVVVRINDRGPYIGGRVIDLGEGAASALGMKSRGVTRVRMQVLN